MSCGLGGNGFASLERAFKLFAVEFAADKDETALMLFAVLPGTLVITFDDHVHTLDNVTLGVVLEGDDPLQAQNVRAFRLGDLLDPGKKRSGFISPPRRDTDCTVTSWIGEGA